MAHDSDYFRRRAAEARSAACTKEWGENAEMAGQLALAYGALARRRATATPVAVDEPAIDPVIAAAAEVGPLMLRD